MTGNAKAFLVFGKRIDWLQDKSTYNLTLHICSGHFWMFQTIVCKIITFPLDIPQSLLTEHFVYLHVPLSDLYKSTMNWYYSSFLTVVVIHCHTKRFWDILILHPVFNILSPVEMSHLQLSMSYAVLLSFILCNVISL